MEDYLASAQEDLKKMKEKYDREKKGLNVKERAKHRNRISALESRIKKRENQDHLNFELDTLKARIGEFTEVLGSTISEEAQEELI